MDARQYRDRARERLEELDRLRRAISRSENRIQELETLATQCGGYSDGEHVQTSAKKDKLEEAVMNIIVEKDRLADAITEWVQESRKVEAELMQLDPVQASVLEAKYILHETDWKTAHRLHYTEGYIRQLRMDGLEEYGRVLNRTRTNKNEQDL